MRRLCILDFGFWKGRFAAKPAQRSRIRRRRHGVTLIELLIAALILSFVAAAALSSWSFSSRVPANLRATELACKIAVREIELMKAKRYINLSAGSTTTYYDSSGAVTVVDANKVYRATTTVGMPTATYTATGTSVLATGTTKDLLQVQVVVTNVAGTLTYETQRTLLTFGGT